MQPLVLHSGTYQVAFVAALILFAAQQLGPILSTLRLGLRHGGVRNDRGSFSVIQCLVAAGIVLAFLAATRVTGATIQWHRPLVFWSGIVLIVFGSLLSWTAVRALGRFFTVVVATRSDQPVIESGPYRYVRHPSYAGQLLVFLGVALTLTNWLSLPAVLLCVLPAYLYRIHVEERALRKELGPAYAEYVARTHRLLPGLY